MSGAQSCEANMQVTPWGSNEALALVQRKLGVDILITGHTHEFKVWFLSFF